MNNHKNLTVTIDFGSTYTKVAAFDLDSEQLVAAAQSKTTVHNDITCGLDKALNTLKKQLAPAKYDISQMMASSSAAGGLQMVAIGLTKALTTKAAQEAVLGAGAKLTGTYSFRLNAEDIVGIEEKTPDIILLAGGTDGGNEKNIVHNANMLSKSAIKAPIIVAGNRNASKEVGAIFQKSGKTFYQSQNIMPELNTLNIAPTQEIIRELFIKRITDAKGLNKARALIGDIIMPTPSAVLTGAALLSEGTSEEPGLGDLLVVDIGGATTDIHSVGKGLPMDAGTIQKGLPEPFAKRTVEGDLGIRFNADAIVDHVGAERILEKLSEFNGKPCPRHIFDDYVEKVSNNVDYLPTADHESLIDICLANQAVEIASRRHAGTLETVTSLAGNFKVQRGKDLTGFSTIVGTGGILAKCATPGKILEAVLFSKEYSEKLLPINPVYLYDADYILHSAGLLESISPSKALRILKKYLRSS